MRIQNTYRLEMSAIKGNYNKDFYRVGINKKGDILKLFRLLKPYLKHAKRCKDLKIAEENIISRINRG